MILSSLLLTLLRLFLFLFISVLIFYFPGRIFLKDKKDDLSLTTAPLSFVLGIIIFTMAAATLGVLRLRFLAFPLILSLAVLSLLINRGRIMSPLFLLLKDKKLSLLFVLGILIQVPINFPSGFRFPGGIYFWSSQGHDGLWHVALIREISRRFPPQNPLYPGHPLVNYHFASDILMGEFYRFFPFFHPLDLYFRFFPVLFSFLLGATAFSFAYLKWSKAVGYWSAFFVYFSGSFGYLWLIYRGLFPLGGETVFWASQGNTILGNPPHTVALILMTAALSFIILWIKNKNDKYLYLAFPLLFALAIFKVSVGFSFLAGLSFWILFRFLKKREWFLFLYVALLALSNFFLLKIISPKASSFLVFEPFWFSRRVMSERLGVANWDLRRQYYLWLNTWKAKLRLIQMELEGVFFFVVGNSGLRIIGFVVLMKKLFRKKFDQIDILLVGTMFTALLIPLLFVQKGSAYNAIQFMQLYFHVLDFYAALLAVSLIAFLNKKTNKVLLALLIVVLSAPTSLGNLWEFYGPGKTPLAKITNNEINALKWVENNVGESEIILTKPFDRYSSLRHTAQPWPISVWASTSYIFAISGRHTFLADEEQLKITGYNVDDDIDKVRKFFKKDDYDFKKRFISQKKINYVYVRKDEGEEWLEREKELQKVFENQEVVIYKIR